MSGLLLSLVTVFFRGFPSLMDCSSWSLACNGLPPFLPGLAPNAGGPNDGGGGGGGPERVAGGGGGGGGNGIAVCTRAGKTDKKQAVRSIVRDHYDGRTTVRRWEGAVWLGRAVRVMCWRHGGAHHQWRSDVCESRARDIVEPTAMTKERNRFWPGAVITAPVWERVAETYREIRTEDWHNCCCGCCSYRCRSSAVLFRRRSRGRFVAVDGREFQNDGHRWTINRTWCRDSQPRLCVYTVRRTCVCRTLYYRVCVCL